MNEKKIVFPDQLNITIRTSIPGYQKIDFKPSMLIKDSEEKSVKFNPLIKLNKTKINQIPKDYKPNSFLNTGLFQSLLNYNNVQPVSSLVQATRNGNIDNNIRITLDNLFPVSSVIYIGKKPYVIGDYQWTNGDWKIEVKQKKEEIDVNKITDPVLYNKLVNENILTGEEQLRELPQSVLTGDNYSGPPIEETLTQVQPLTTQVQPPTTQVQPQQQETQEIVPYKKPLKQALKQEETQEIVPYKKPLKQEETQEIVPYKKPTKQKELLQDKPQVSSKLFLPPPTNVEELTPEEEQLFDSFKNDIKVQTNNTEFFRKYFINKNYFQILNNLFIRFPDEIKKQIKRFYYITTNYESPRKNLKGLSPQAYNMLCNQVSIIQSPADGNCFFKAVADGININNYENQDKKIIYNNYGKTQLFTVSILREIVFRYLNNLGTNIIQSMLSLSLELADDLNAKFKSVLTEETTQEQYMILLNTIYNSNQNFLVYKPKIVPVDVDEYESPFRVLQQNEIPSYINSRDYWANEVAIQAICETLKIAVVSIENYEYNKSVRIRARPSTLNKLRTLFINNNLIRERCSSKVMFLYYKNNHYELIRFQYKTKEQIKIMGEGSREIKTFSDKWYTIFEKDGLIPPIHILLLIYGSFYIWLDDEAKQNFSLYIKIMKLIHNSMKKIAEIPDNETFMKIFNAIFPSSSKENTLSNKIMTAGADGATPDVKPVYNYNYYNQPLKTNIDKDFSKIAYGITVDLELHEGTSLTPQQIMESKCNNKYNNIRKSYAEFVGKPYVLPPVYNGGSRRKTRKIKH
jgi:hypothetical protein